MNAGLCNDLLISKKEGTDDWVFSNKDEGQLAAAASIGLLQIWDIDEGLDPSISTWRDPRTTSRLVPTSLWVS